MSTESPPPPPPQTAPDGRPLGPDGKPLPGPQQMQQVMAQRRMAQQQAQVDEVVGIMKNNVEKVLERDSKLSELDNRADALQQASTSFNKSESVSEQKPLRQSSSTGKDESTNMDFTKVPSTLDMKFEKLDTDSALRPTLINVGEKWGKKSFKSLRGKPVEKSLWSKEQDEEKTRCYDLLDALSCSGSLEIDCASLHVIVAATHCFDESIVNTIVQNNINPIEKVERSILIVGSTIQGMPPGQLIRQANLAQIESHSPHLLHENEEAMEQ